jgi:DNA repair protein RecO (recombination protein O)
MNSIQAQAIILSRTDYGEADRIINLLTAHHGKVAVIAKGVRKQKSKLAGGIELFSVSQISYIPGRRDISTLISSRLIRHYGQIVKDLERTNLAYALIKRLDKATEDSPEPDYFELLWTAFESLDDLTLDRQVIELWFNAQLLRLAGHTPNLRTTKAGDKLEPDKTYDFSYESMNFEPGGKFTVDAIKFLRLLFSHNLPKTLARVQGTDKLVSACQPLVQAMLSAYIRV